MIDTVDRLVWLYYIAAIFTLILGVWLGHVITLIGIRAWIDDYIRMYDNESR